MHFLRIVGVMLFSLFVLPVLAQAGIVDELIVKSGLEFQVRQIPEVMRVSFEQRFNQDSKLSAEEQSNIKKSAMESFDPVVMLKFVRERVTAGLTEKDMGEILQWLNSPLGQKITEQEKEASSGDGYRKMIDFAQNMPRPEASRLALVERLDREAGLTECSVQMKMGIALAISEAMACSTGCENFSRDEVVQQIEKARPQIEEGSRQEFLVSALYTYQSLTDQEMEEYIQFYQTAPGQKYMKVMTVALSDALNDASKIMGQKLGELLKEKKAKTP